MATRPQSPTLPPRQHEPGESVSISLLEMKRPEYNFNKIAASDRHWVFRHVLHDRPLEPSRDKSPERRRRFDFKLPKGISYVNCVFSKLVDFSFVTSDGPLYFWNCRFEDEARFYHVAVKSLVLVPERELGEANFSYCVFDQSLESSRREPPPGREGPARPSFDRADFDGPVYFHKTVFNNSASFEEVRFRKYVWFQDSETDICYHKTRFDFLSEKQLNELRSARILFDNRDHDDHLNFDWKLGSTRSLRKLLPLVADPAASPSTAPSRPSLHYKEHWPADHVSKIVELWETRSKLHMFGQKSPVLHTFGQVDGSLRTSFKGTQFGTGSRFLHVDLGTCLFQASNIASADLKVVRWFEQPCGLFVRRLGLPLPVFTWRTALADEVELDADQALPEKEQRSRRRELSGLYRELRLAYDKQGDSQTARDFHFGELEAERLSQVRWTRWLRLSFWYRGLSGYSKREGLAAWWLVATMFLVFPVAYLFWVNFAERDRLNEAKAKTQQWFKDPQACHMIGPEFPGRPTEANANGPDHLLHLLDAAIVTAWGNDRILSWLSRPELDSLQALQFPCILRAGHNHKQCHNWPQLDKLRPCSEKC